MKIWYFIRKAVIIEPVINYRLRGSLLKLNYSGKMLAEYREERIFRMQRLTDNVLLDITMKAEPGVGWEEQKFRISCEVR